MLQKDLRKTKRMMSKKSGLANKKILETVVANVNQEKKIQNIKNIG